jgi:ApaG protein
MSIDGGGRVQLFHAITEGIRVSVRPAFAPEHSDPGESRYVFIYRIRIENLADFTARLLWRHWFIEDPVGGDSEVQGEGVVGETPTLEPGDVHEYRSFCVLEGPSGSMRGTYVFRLSDGTRLDVTIPRFELRAAGP